MPSVLINNLFKINELIKLTYNDPKAGNRSGKLPRPELEEEEDGEPIAITKNILFERKIIRIKSKYQVVQQFAKKNYFLELREGTGWDIYWTDKQFLPPRQLKSMMPYQRINYFPGMSILTNKQNLTQRLNLYKTLFPGQYDFFPPTWIVEKHCENVPSETIDNVNARQESERMMNNNLNNVNLRQESEGMMTNKHNLELHKDNNENIIKTEYVDTPLCPKMEAANLTSDVGAKIEYKVKTESSESNKTDNGMEIHTEDKSDEPCHNRQKDINKRLDKLEENKINGHYNINKSDQHKISNPGRRLIPQPMCDITNKLDNRQDNVLRNFDQTNISNDNSKHAMFSEAEHKCDKTNGLNESDITTKFNEKHDKTSTIEENRRFAETNPETNVLIDKRLTKENDFKIKPKQLENEMKPKLKDIRTNSITMPSLRPTVRNNKDFRRNSVVNEKTGTPSILLKDNVRNMVQALNRLNKTNETVDKWRNMTKDNITKRNARQDSSDQNEDSMNEHDDGTKSDRDKIRKENKDLEDTKNNRKAVASENEKSNVESFPIYILKPCNGCQGKGIQLVMNMNDVIQHMAFDSMVCQQYITNPLLWNGYKFDIRLYVLVTSVKQLRVYIYNEGLVRLATEKYEPPNETNLNNMCMHLTNYAINKDSENFDENLSKRSLDAMNKFLTEEHGVDLKSLYGKINNIIVKTILAGYKPILKEYLETFKMYVYREACFQLLGFDIILDTNCNPYLLEINKNASLNRPTPIDRVIKTNLTRDLFSILNLNENRFRGDILRDNLNYNTYRKHYIEHEMNHRGDFSMIYPCNGQEEYSKLMID
uniref:Tubulin polyglutamylase TTLL6 n=1 Tax=Cacopsylla melanoneura TaxID=428564 RepID=A0A8D8LSL2_9HEMI